MGNERKAVVGTIGAVAGGHDGHGMGAGWVTLVEGRGQEKGSG